MLNSFYLMLVSICLLSINAQSDETGLRVRKKRLIDTSNLAAIQSPSQSDIDVGVKRHEILDEDVMEQLSAFFDAGVFANEQSAASEPRIQYMMSASTRDESNYRVEITFEYECNTTAPPPNTSPNWEPSLLEYHAYVNEVENQALNSFGITVLDEGTSGCAPINNGGRRKLLRGLRYTFIAYNLFSFCFGPCPEQLLPEIETINRRRFLQEEDKYKLKINPLPYQNEFKNILLRNEDIEVSQATTGPYSDTAKMLCGDPEVCFNSDVCCGTTGCRCKKVSPSLCTATACDLSLCCTDQEEICQSSQTCSCSSRQCSDRSLCCDINIFQNCNEFCPVPTAFPTKFPTAFPTNFPTDFPTKSPTDIPTKSPTDFPTKSPTDFPTKSPTDFPTKSPTDFPTKSPTDFPTKSPTDFPTKSPTDFPSKSPTDFPSNPITNPPTCGNVTFTLILYTDSYPEETSWNLTNSYTGTGVANDAYESGEENERFTYNESLDTCRCYIFSINDSFGDGLTSNSYGIGEYVAGNYTVKLNELVVRFGGNFTFFENTTLGGC